MRSRLSWGIPLVIALVLLLALAVIVYASGPEFVSNWPADLTGLSTSARNDSSATTCARDQNVNVPIFAGQISRFEVKATNPTNPIGSSSCSHNTSGCTGAPTPPAESCTKLFDNITNVIEGCTVSGWWRGLTMHVTTPDKSGDYHYVRLIRKIEDADSWPQVLRLYEDGIMKLKPHPPQPLIDSCFGSSVIIGAATPSSQPYADIESAQVNPLDSPLSLDVTYRSGESAHISLTVDRSQAVATVDVSYAANASIPFATFRSIYVRDGNADVDHVEAPAGDFPILTGWTVLEGPWWFFHRDVANSGNDSAPDIRVTALDQQTTPTSTATAVGQTVTPTRTATGTRTTVAAATMTPTTTRTRTGTPTTTRTPLTPVATPTATASPSAGELSTWAENHSSIWTPQAPLNVNVPIFADQISRFEIKATHPTYLTGTSNCSHDSPGCIAALVQPSETCTTLFDDFWTVVQGCTVPGWWRGLTMQITTPTGSGNYHYVILSRKMPDADRWPQFFVLYEDGSARLKPHPPQTVYDVVFGSYVMVGAATPSSQPYVDIESVQVNPSTWPLGVDVTYRSGETAHISLTVDQSQAVATVDVSYAANASIPFATFRSMYVRDGDADVDHIEAPAGDFPILTGWTVLEGPWWFFHRDVPSSSDASAPDIRITVLDQQTTPTSTATAVGQTATPTRTATGTRTTPASPTPTASPTLPAGSLPVRVTLPMILAYRYFEGPWEQEENDTYLTANGPILPDRDYLGHPNDSHDFYSINLFRPGSVVADMTVADPGREMQILLYYLQPRTQTLTLIDYAGGPPYHVSSGGEVPAGWYYILVYTFPSSYSQESVYTLWAQFAP